MGRKKRLTVTEKVKRYRIDKRRPKRMEQTTKADYGSYEEMTKVVYPEDATITKTVIPKKANPNLFWLWEYPIRLVYYTDTEKGFAYDSGKNYCGSFDKYHLKRLHSRIHLLLEEIKGQNT
jgi:hypothetical protein